MWKKYGTAWQATDDNILRLMHFACWIKKNFRHTLRLCNIYFFSTATFVARAHLSVTLYIHCLSGEILLTIKMNSELRCMLPVEIHDSWRGYKARQMILGNAVLKQPSLRLLPSLCYPLFTAASSDQKFTVHYEVTPLFSLGEFLTNISRHPYTWTFTVKLTSLVQYILKHVPLYPNEFLKFWLKITANCNNLFLPAK
jgi:hypothetical protein